MTAPLFWTLYLPATGALFLIAAGTGYLIKKAAKAYRRWCIRCEIADMKTRQMLDAAARLGGRR